MENHCWFLYFKMRCTLGCMYFNARFNYLFIQSYELFWRRFLYLVARNHRSKLSEFFLLSQCSLLFNKSFNPRAFFLYHYQLYAHDIQWLQKIPTKVYLNTACQDPHPFHFVTCSLFDLCLPRTSTQV